jgi:hypothetical protein
MQAMENESTHCDFADSRDATNLPRFIEGAVNVQGGPGAGGFRIFGRLETVRGRQVHGGGDLFRKLHSSNDDVDDVGADRAALKAGPAAHFLGFFFRAINEQGCAHNNTEWYRTTVLSLLANFDLQKMAGAWLFAAAILMQRRRDELRRQFS